jgi:hypothetical protein
MNYTFYNPDTGEIIGVISTSDLITAEKNLQDKIWIEGYYNPLEYYIANGQAVAKSVCPKDGREYQYNLTTNQWILNIEKESQSMRKLRDNNLSAIDRVNPVRYASLTTDEQNQLAVYRQQLLDVPQQAGFPTQVEWPSKPVWL